MKRLIASATASMMLMLGLVVGTRIVFVMFGGSIDGWPDIFIVDPFDGSHLFQVTDTPVTESIPNWGTHPLAA